jgi:trimeric autotransporter adhesin
MLLQKIESHYNVNNILKKVVATIILTTLVASSPLAALAAPRSAPFTPGQTLDPGLEVVEPCGPTDSNCYPSAITLVGGSVTNINSTSTNITSNATTTISGPNTIVNSSTTVINSSSTNINSSSTVINSSSTTITGTTTVTNLVLGSLTGFLKAVGGVVSASSSVSLVNDVLGILGISKGGTGTTTAPVAGQILIGNSFGTYDLVSTSTLFSQLATTSSTTNLLSTTTNTFQSIVNGVSSLVANIINSISTSIAGNVLTTNVNGVIATTTVISANTISYSTSSNVLSSNINGILATTSLYISPATSTTNTLVLSTNVLSSNVNSILATSSIIESNYLSFSSSTGLFTSTINGVVATTSITAVVASTTNTISTSTNSFQTIVNGISSVFANIVNTLTTSLSGNVLTTTVNGVSATSSVISANTLSFASTTGLLTSTINGVLATTTLEVINGISFGLPTGSNANGGSISSNVLTLSFADATNPGIVSTGTQTFAGDKTYTGLTSLNGTTIRSGNTLTFNNAANTFGTSFVAGNNAANLALTLPTADGTDGTSLFTNGSGVLSFRSPYTFIARVAATTNAALATAYENGDTVDGVVLATGNIIILSAQTATSENGVYTVNASGAPTRVVNSQIKGQQTFVTAGTANITKTFTLTSTNTYSTALAVTSPITVQNTTSLFSTGLTGTGAGSTGVDSVFLGTNAGNGALNASYSNFFGPSTGVNAINALNSNFLGVSAGGNATNAYQSNFFGNNAGDSATGASDSNFFGFEAGSGATSANNSNFLGNIAGTNALNASHSNFFGTGTGGDATNATFSNFIGYDAGNAATNASFSNFIGANAGTNATNAKNSIFIGSNAGLNDTVNNVVSGTSILIGRNTNTGGFSNSIALGANAVNTAANQLTLGSTSSPINQILTSSNLAINSGTSSSLTLDSGTTGSVNLGTGANSKSITIGSLFGSTGISQFTGTAGTINTSLAATTSAFEIVAHSLTSGKGLYLQSSSAALTGDLQNITLSGDNAANTGNILNLTSSGVNSLTKGLSVTTSGSKGLAALFSGAIAQASANYSTVGLSNNVSFGNFGVVRLTGATAQTITGIDDLQSSGTGASHVDGRMLTIINAGTFAATFANASTSSAVNNRILTGTGLDFSLLANASINMIYDATAAKWRIIGGSGSVTSFSSVDITNRATGGNIGTAATTVDVSTNFNVNQTTTLQVVTIPSPTDTLLTKGKIITINNVGTADFQIGGITVIANSYGSAFVWTGSAWNPVNAASNVVAESGNVILNNQSFTTNTFVDSTNGVFVIPSAGKWVLRYDVNTDSSTGATTNTQIQIVDSSNTLVSGTERTRGGVTTALVLTGQAEVITTGATTYKLQLRNGGSGTLSLLSNAQNSATISWQKVGGNLPISGQTVDFVNAQTTNSVAYSATGNITNTFSVSSGNIPVNAAGGEVTLTAGKTYELVAYLAFNAFATANDDINISWVDSSNVQIIGQSAAFVDNTATPVLQGFKGLATLLYTPTSDQTVHLRINSISGTINIGTDTSIIVKQIGSTAATGVSFNSLTAAIAAGTLDNTNYAQVWNWSAATTETGLTMSANALTTGTIQKLMTSSTALTGNTGVTGAGSLLDINATGAATAFAGNLASIQNTGLTSVGNTGTALNINLVGTGQIMQGLGVTSASTGLTTNGIARFNFTGAHSGSGVQIDDVTTSGNILRINAPGLTGGSALSIISAGTTGTGSVLQVSSNSTSNLVSGGVRFNFNNAHTGTAMQVDSGTLIGNAMLVNANSLTTGSGLSVLSSYGAGNSTNGLLRVANTGATTNGTIFRAQANSTAGAGLTVNADGTVGIGVTSSIRRFQASLNDAALSTAYIVNTNTGTNTNAMTLGLGNTGTLGVSNLFLSLRKSSTDAAIGTEIGSISGNGSGGVAYNTTSDERLKADTGLNAKGLEALMGLKVYNYNWKESGVNNDGFFAQQLHSVFPQAVTVGTDEVDENGKLMHSWKVDYGAVTPLLAKAIQDQQSLLGNFATDTNTGLQLITDATNTNMYNYFATNTIANLIVGKISNGIKVLTDFVAIKISAISGYFDKLFTKELCIAKANGENVCITGEDLERIKNIDVTKSVVNTDINMKSSELITSTVSDLPDSATSTNATSSISIEAVNCVSFIPDEKLNAASSDCNSAQVTKDISVLPPVTPLE